MTTELNRPLPMLASDVCLAPDVFLGEGTVVLGEVELQSGVRVGHHCVLEGTPDRKTVIESDTVLEDYVRIFPGVRIGAESRVEAYTILGHPTKADLTGRDDVGNSERVKDLLVEAPETSIGPGALIRSHSVIYTHVEIGASMITGHFIMIREHTRIGDGSVFGTHASTDGYCYIGPLAHIGQYAQLSQAARIGRGVFVGGHTVFSDNKQAIRDISEDLFGATVGDYVRIGLGCVILPSVQIHGQAMVGAGSVVTKDIPKGALAYGNPARAVRQLTAKDIRQYISSVEPGTTLTTPSGGPTTDRD